MRWALLFLLMLNTPLFAQVHSITQTKDGAVWVGTAEGLYRLDSGKMRLVKSGTFHSLFATQNEIWAATDQGLMRCADSSCKKDLRLPTQKILFLAGQDSRLWAATESQVREINAQTTKPLEIPPTTIEAIAIDSNFRVWLGCREFVGRLKDGVFQKVLNTSAQALATDKQGTVWIGSGFEIIHWIDEKTQTYNLPPPLANVRMMPPITTIFASENNVWIGTRTGLLRLKAKKFQEIVPDLMITALFEENKSTLWIGSTEGLKKIVNGKMQDVALPTAPGN